MSVAFTSAGATVAVEAPADSPWTDLAAEASAGHRLPQLPDRVDVNVVVDHSTAPFPTATMEVLTRGAWTDGRSVVIENACTSGLDLRLTFVDGTLCVDARARPSWSTRALRLAAPGRAQLLQRAVLVQYPALWWAGTRGAVPLHVSAVQAAGVGLAFGGPGGVGKSTQVARAVEGGARPVSDNLCVADGLVVHGLLEPMRTTEGSGRRMPHGRRESTWPSRLECTTIDGIVLLRRGRAQEPEPAIHPVDPAAAARILTAGTYAAGELRRYWAFAATLALGTGRGPGHPDITAAASSLTARTRCLEVRLPADPSTPHAHELIDELVARVSSESPEALATS